VSHIAIFMSIESNFRWFHFLKCEFRQDTIMECSEGSSCLREKGDAEVSRIYLFAVTRGIRYCRAMLDYSLVGKERDKSALCFSD
jgi:hypothetical protein